MVNYWLDLFTPRTWEEARQRNLCGDFIDQALRTWHWIQVSESTGINVSEESITDFALLELQSRHPHEIKTRKFSRYEESLEGADWEWWLTSRNFWLGLRVQAKKIEPKNLEYPTLDKTNNQGNRQIDLLIDNAIGANPRMIPAYVFYNYWDLNRLDPEWLCGAYPKTPQLLGCGLSHAMAVRGILLNRSKKLKDLTTVMYPWSCIVCCREYSQNGRFDLPYRAFDFLAGAFYNYVKETEFAGYHEEKFVVREAPSYVYKIMEQEPLSDEEWAKTKANRIVVIIEKSEAAFKSRL